MMNDEALVRADSLWAIPPGAHITKATLGGHVAKASCHQPNAFIDGYGSPLVT